MSLPSSPNNRKEVYLSNIAGQGTALPSEPHTREEEYLDYIAKNGGGGGGTGEGDMTKAVYDDDLAVASAGGIKAYVTSAISDKVDKVQGKSLSTNDYDDSAKAIVDGVTTALDGKVSKSNIAGLLKNDGTVDTNTYAQTSALSGYIAKSNTAGLVKNDGTIDTTTTGAVAANASAISAIKDGTNIDSFGDVETALGNKQDTISDLSTIRSGATAGATAIQPSATAGLVKNDGTIDTTITGAVSANTTAISNIKDGTNIDSFGDVEDALALKAGYGNLSTGDFFLEMSSSGGVDTLESVSINKDDEPTLNSTKAIESGAVYNALRKKQPKTNFNNTKFSVTADLETGEETVNINTADPGSNDFRLIDANTAYNKMYSQNATAETDIADDDYFPFFDASVGQNGIQRKTLWSNIKSKLAAIFASKANVIANTKLIKDTVGWSGKNICPYPKGTRQVILSDGSIQDNSDMYLSDYVSVDGISKLRISVGSVTGSSIAFRIATYDTSKTFIERISVAPTASTPIIQTLGSTVKYVRFCFEDNSSIARYTQQMVIDNNILDTSYEPPFNSTAVDWASYAKTGVHNNFKFPYRSIGGADSGGTFIINSDKTVTASGTFTGNGEFRIMDYITDNRYEGWIISSNAEFSEDFYIRIREALSDGTFVREIRETDGKIIIPHMDSGHKYYVAGRVGTTGSAINITLKPTLSVPDDTYKGYTEPTMTNSELTEKTNDLSRYRGHSSAYNGNVTKITITEDIGTIIVGSVLILFIRHYTSATTFVIREAYVNFYMDGTLKAGISMLHDDNSLPAITKVEQTSAGLEITFSAAVYATVGVLRLT